MVNPHRRCADVDGAAMEVARQRKERTYPELTGGGNLVVLAGEIGGRFSHGNTNVHSPSRAGQPPALSLSRLRTRARLSWMHRWGSLLACTAARAFSSSLLDRRGQPGADGEMLTMADVVSDFCKTPGAQEWVAPDLVV